MQLSYLLSLSFLLGAAVASPSQAKSAGLPAPPGAKRTFTAFGLGVSNYTKSFDFYTRVLGLHPSKGLDMSTEMFDETILTSDSGSAFLLMTFKDKVPRSTKHMPIKMVFGVPSVGDQIEAIRKEGYKIVVEPDPIIGIVGMAEDPDGNLLEFNPSW